VGIRLNLATVSTMDSSRSTGSEPTGGGFNAMLFQPVRWLNETAPNTPITVVPGPGAAGAVLLGALGLAARRTRRE